MHILHLSCLFFSSICHTSEQGSKMQTRCSSSFSSNRLLVSGNICGKGYRGWGQNDNHTVCVCVSVEILGIEDRLTATEPCCGLIPSQVTKGHTCALVSVHEREGLSTCVYACKQLYTCMFSLHTHTHTHNYTWVFPSTHYRAEQHRGPAVCPKPTVHSFLSHWAFYCTQHHIWITETSPKIPVYVGESVWEEWHFKSCISTGSFFIVDFLLKFQRHGEVGTQALFWIFVYPFCFTGNVTSLISYDYALFFVV